MMMNSVHEWNLDAPSCLRAGNFCNKNSDCCSNNCVSAGDSAAGNGYNFDNGNGGSNNPNGNNANIGNGNGLCAKSG
ncbi:unnamed protein product, partial [Rotaria sp. Silwood1]